MVHFTGFYKCNGVKLLTAKMFVDVIFLSILCGLFYVVFLRLMLRNKKTLKISELGFELLQNITTFADP